MIHVFHRWSRWRNITITKVTMSWHGTETDSVAGQERVCLTCGKVQWREI